MSARPALLVALAADADPTAWIEAFRENLPGFDILTPATVAAPEEVRYVVAWKHPHGSLAAYQHLRAIFSLGAGVDHLLADDALPPGVPVARVVDPDLTNRMSEYVVLHVLMHHRQQRLYDYQQYEKIWADDAAQPAARDVRVGIMGLGVMGQDAGRKLALLGFDVAGWSQGRKTLDGIATFAGAAERAAFLARTEILVVLLPLTPQTRGILNHDLFAGLARDCRIGGPVLINAGRGGLQDESAILAALDDGTLRAATLDVFEEEPLPQASPLWHHPAVTITPHNAAISNATAVATYIAGQITGLEAGRPADHVVDRATRY